MKQGTQTSALGHQEGRVGREVRERLRIWDTCTPKVDSCQCMAKPPQYCKVINLQLKSINLKKENDSPFNHFFSADLHIGKFLFGEG